MVSEVIQFRQNIERKLAMGRNSGHTFFQCKVAVCFKSTYCRSSLVFQSRSIASNFLTVAHVLAKMGYHSWD